MVLNTNYELEVLKILRTLDDDKKQKVLDIVKKFSKRPKTVSDKDFLENTRHIRITDDDATEMMQAIEGAFNIVKGESGQTIIEDIVKLKFDNISLNEMEKAIQEIDNSYT